MPKKTNSTKTTKLVKKKNQNQLIFLVKLKTLFPKIKKFLQE